MLVSPAILPTFSRPAEEGRRGPMLFPGHSACLNPPSLSQHLDFNHPFSLLEALPHQYPLHLFFAPSLPAPVSSTITTMENLSLNLVTLLLVCSLFSGFPFQAD